MRVARIVSAVDGGRILNEKTATSQITGGTVGGIAMALLEETLPTRPTPSPPTATWATTSSRSTLTSRAGGVLRRRTRPNQPPCEHLLGACAEFATALVERCPGVAVLATSREPLRLPGEVVWRVPSLELPDLRLPADPARLARLDSVQLFLERAGNASPAFRLDCATALPVARICLRLDGIPLALELVASRIAHLAAAELAARLDDALAAAAGGRAGRS